MINPPGGSDNDDVASMFSLGYDLRVCPMVIEQHDPQASVRRFVVKPNQALSWTKTKTLFYSLCCVSLGIAGGFCLLGAWLILPFAGLEMAALGIALYVCACRSGHCEVITIGSDAVEVAAGRRRVRQTWEFQRPWVQVRWEKPPHPWYGSRLALFSHGRGVEVGQALNEKERQALARALKAALND
ncbi:MAG: DUF2244 domain-containing protein [Gammaproteobacteria bacterium]|nr:MAG: DUF2244 domain-containing protein [Gammaproteobacteria bacterium]